MLPAARNLTLANSLFLGGMVLHNLSYPLAGAGGIWPAVFYLYYGALFVLATWALSASRPWRAMISAAGVLVLCAGLANSYGPTPASALAVYVSSILYHLGMIIVLARYTFGARRVMTDVLLAATSLYLVLGSAFAALLALIEWAAPGSFVAGTGAAIGWQQMLYFSYVTLTTLGYGDILPVGSVAQSVTTFEAICGTLYTVILLSRLVGLHASRS
ncbi:potassium channel family protein [Pseudooceanicola sp. C21-150M6]|uniref:potassium channel family protein n=1 Tax=Pseudooceanicola sp. C21-150M6 TaxID=3434355 RepID=UPI003D7FF783